jgi:hypothetical protein
MIPTRANRLIWKDRHVDGAEVPKEFWWAHGEAALNQDWIAGDFSTWIDGEHELRAYGVTFSRAGIDALTGPANAIRPPPADPAPNAGGRPPAAWWDELWIDIARQLYEGDLKPGKQADIESAMKDWAAAHGHNPADSTIRPRARKLWIALTDKDKN